MASDRSSRSKGEENTKDNELTTAAPAKPGRTGLMGTGLGLVWPRLGWVTLPSFRSLLLLFRRRGCTTGKSVPREGDGGEPLVGLLVTRLEGSASSWRLPQKAAILVAVSYLPNPC